MMIQMLKTKIKELTVSESSIHYPGSISLPEEILKASGIKPFEMVHVNNKTNGNRITTYAVKSKTPGQVTLNGAASHHFSKGDQIHVLAYALLNEGECDTFEPILVLTDKENRLLSAKPYLFD
ncbi:aspartate 1-decarboxylase [Sphingobacteriaceae bacterium]|nr:aspartate 1-decarboxylase [Sphingobacteriaceae bacterium]